MRIDELVARLLFIQSQEGNLEVYTCTPGCGSDWESHPLDIDKLNVGSNQNAYTDSSIVNIVRFGY